ncbi:spore coat protein [Alicyclobacillus tolerans]|uniref:Spore coat protein CotF n=2 Tax=Alicyclobacillus tolerans TaxID=90970 RepID=A0ABT9LZL9_9BACL|nr:MULTISPECIES: spore coat protein [Alicyclobacillus]MDP9729729.1 spore coat protein CotF [Alicyclobacillus tengchongensis]QRF22845.1 spore coat protein [Alicyclobacillus sp. TC]SHK73406.1 Coat F domain-containing protein [Alicyclobacillus montanus]
MNSVSTSNVPFADREALTDALSTCKYLTDSFNTAVREAGCDHLHSDLMTVLTETHQMARQIFHVMQKKGWYPIEQAPADKLQKAQGQIQNMIQEVSQIPLQ